MTADKHPGEIEIQRYALDEKVIEADTVQHIAACENCKTRVANYKMLFLSIEQLPDQGFDFDISRIILAQLPAQKTAVAPHRIYNYTMVFMICTATAVPIYLFRKFFINVTSGISIFLLSVIAISAISITFYKVIEMYRKYQKQINTLNFH